MKLICRNCKSIITYSKFIEKKYGIIQNVFCKRCKKEVEAFIVRTEWAKWNPKNIEPTESDEKIATAIGQIIPIMQVLYVIDNSRKLLKFLILRFLAFVLLLYSQSMKIGYDFNNPYFLLITSSVFIVLIHLIHKIKIGWDTSFSDSLVRYFYVIFYGIFLWGPFVVLEILLFTYNALFFVIEVVIGILMLIYATENYKK